MRMPTRRVVLRVGLLGAAGLIAVGASAQAEPEIATDFRGLALDGFDPLAYIVSGEAIEGSAAYEFQWRGATWRFATEESMAHFAGDPERYAPAFGGHCALAVAQGALEHGDPQAWDVIDGRVYVKASSAAQAAWRRDPRRFIRQAEINWPLLINASY